MMPYFFCIDDYILSQSCKTNIYNYAVNQNTKFTAYQMKGGGYDGNNYLKFNLDLEEIVNLNKKCKLKFYTMLIMHKPFATVVKHRDGPFGRNCVLSIPINPKINYPSTKFYDDNNNFVSECKFNNLQPAFLNTQQTHGLKNGNNMRLNLQLCFEESFTCVVDLYKKDKLFKN